MEISRLTAVLSLPFILVLSVATMVVVPVEATQSNATESEQDLYEWTILVGEDLKNNPMTIVIKTTALVVNMVSVID